MPDVPSSGVAVVAEFERGNDVAPAIEEAAVDAAWNGRPLFKVAVEPEPPQAAIIPTVMAPAPPLLKGIIEADSQLRAVFLVGDSGTPQYEVVRAGEVIAGTEVVSIDRDGVVARMQDGATTVLKLRGPGEAP